MLKKREIFRSCFAGFDYDRIAAFTDEDVDRIMNTDGMIRSPRKIRAVIHNAQCFQKVREEYGSFCDYIWAYSGGKTILYQGHDTGRIPVSNGLSEKISKDLKRRGFKYVGPVTIYSHLQACGIICDETVRRTVSLHAKANDHDKECDCFRKINMANPTVRKRRQEEKY